MKVPDQTPIFDVLNPILLLHSMDNDTIREMVPDALRNHGNHNIGHFDNNADSGLQKQIESEILTLLSMYEKTGFQANDYKMPYRPSLTLKPVEFGKVDILLV